MATRGLQSDDCSLPIPLVSFAYPRGTVDLLLFVSLSFASVPSERENSPVHLYSVLSACGRLSTETLSPHTFPYDLPYICPALRPRLRRTHSLIVRPRSLPLSEQRKPHAISKISGLYHAAFVLAVYASQILSPRPMQNSLPVTCSVLLDGMHGSPWLPLGHSERFLLFPPFTSLSCRNHIFID